MLTKILIISFLNGSSAFSPKKGYRHPIEKGQRYRPTQALHSCMHVKAICQEVIDDNELNIITCHKSSVKEDFFSFWYKDECAKKSGTHHITHLNRPIYGIAP